MGRRRNKNASRSLMAQDGTPRHVQEMLAARLAKRAAKAAERRQKSDALREEGSALSLEGKFHDALDRYQRAIAVHKGSTKPVLLADLATTYLDLEMYPEAHDAAEKALIADPKSIEARYCRGIAREHMMRLDAAAADFRLLLMLSPEYEAIKSELEQLSEEISSPSHQIAEEDTYSPSGLDAPALEDDPQLGEPLSESSDCEHTGNGIPCLSYNRGECKRGHACRYSHAPDAKSERDALGRNVCKYYLMGLCNSGTRCRYLHSKEHLSQETFRTQEKVEKVPNLQDSYDQTRASGTGRAPKKAKGKKKSTVAAAGNQATRAQAAPSTGNPSRRHRVAHVRGPIVRPSPSEENDLEEASGTGRGSKKAKGKKKSTVAAAGNQATRAPAASSTGQPSRRHRVAHVRKPIVRHDSDEDSVQRVSPLEALLGGYEGVTINRCVEDPWGVVDEPTDFCPGYGGLCIPISMQPDYYFWEE